MDRNLIRQLVCVLSVVGTITGNALANIIPFNGQTTGAVSNKFDVLFTPAGYVFAIWGVLYITWCVFAVYQLFPSRRTDPRLVRITYLFALSGGFNVLWLFLWHYEYFALTVIVMLCLLALLITIYLRLNVGHVKVGVVEKICVDIPFSLYLAWISVATIANITIFLRSIAWSAWGIPEPVWANIMIATATALGAIACLRRRDFAFIAVLIWAFLGIADKQVAAPAVQMGAWAASAALGAIAVFTLALSLQRRISRSSA